MSSETHALTLFPISAAFHSSNSTHIQKNNLPIALQNEQARCKFELLQAAQKNKKRRPNFELHASTCRIIAAFHEVVQHDLQVQHSE